MQYWGPSLHTNLVRGTRVIFFITLFLVVNSVDAFVRTKTSAGSDIYWNSSSVSLYVNPTYGSLSDSNVSTVVSNSVGQWNSLANMTISTSTNYSSPQSYRNDFYFSDSATYFGSNAASSGVLGVTAVTYYTSSGQIVEADVVINQDKTFTNTATTTNPGNSSSFFLGDVLTHELGHFLGLGHGQVKDSSMVFTVYRGQSTSADDDKAAIKTIYPNSSNVGTITGRAIGGSGSTYIGVLGAHVHAISTVDGKVASSAFSDENGYFTISGLDLNDTYYIYISPGNVIYANSASYSPLPSYYTSAKSNFCTNGASYQGAFYQSCNSNDSGFPQGVRLTSSSKSQNIGNVSVKCSYSTASNYTSNAKNSGTWNLNDSLGDTSRSFIQSSNSAMGETITGSFTSTQILLNSTDEFQVDLTGLSAPSGKQLDIKVVASSIFAPTRMNLVVTDGASTTYSPTYVDVDSDSSADTGLVLDSDSNINLDQTLRVGLHTGGNTGNNIFTITLTPEIVNNNLTLAGDDNEWFFPANSFLKDSTAKYLLIISVTNTSDNSMVYPRSYTISDNSSCADGPNTYSVSANTSTSTAASTTVQTTKASGFGCGSIDIGGGPPPPGQGPLSFAIGLMVGLMMLTIAKMKQIRRRVRFRIK